MNGRLGATWFGLTFAAFLVLGGSAEPAHAQYRDAGHAAGTRPDAMQANAVGPGPRERGERVELVHLPIIGAAGLIEKGGRSIRLVGVEATALDAQCGSGADAWPCGRVARAALQRLVRRRSLECRMPENGGTAADIARCSVRGRDIGEWLVAQGWAKADGPFYADAEETARKEARGLWSPVRPGLSTNPVFGIGPALANAAVRAEIDLSDQSMTLVHRGRILGLWRVSTARRGKETPTGVWTAKWLSRHHRSRLYDNAPMPWSVFYDGDYAVHGTYQTARLGRPASNGCVRLSPEHAAILFDLVRAEGLDNTLIVIRH